MTTRRSWLNRSICDGPWPKPLSATTLSGTVVPRVVGTALVNADLQRLMDVTEGAMWAGFAAARLGGRVTDISHAVESFVRSHGGRRLDDTETVTGTSTGIEQP